VRQTRQSAGASTEGTTPLETSIAADPANISSHIRLSWSEIPGLLVAFLAAGFALMNYLNFWLGVILVLSTFCLFGRWCWTRDWLRIKRWSATSLTVLACVVCVWTIFRPAPVSFQLSASKSVYPEGSLIAGVKWYTNCVEAHLRISNPSSRDYDNVDLTFSANPPFVIMGMGNNSAISATLFSEDLPPKPGLVLGTRDANGNLVEGQGVSSGWGYHYRIRIGSLPKKSTVDLVAVLAQFTPPPHDRILNRKLLAPASLPSSVSLSGSFTASGRPVSVTTSVEPIAQETILLQEKQTVPNPTPPLQ